MRLALVFVMVIHGLIHLLGFVKAFQLANVQELTQHVSRTSGLCWLLATLLLLGSATGILLKKEWWWLVAFMAVALSQFLIVSQWNDAKFGTALNVLILASAMIGYSTWKFYDTYRKDVKVALSKINPPGNDLITENDLQHLPLPVQQYLRYVGVVGTPKIQSVKMEFEGEIRGKGQDWFSFYSEQCNTFSVPNRLFFIRGKMKGIDVPGYHAYKDGTATMTVKLLSLFPVVRRAGKEMDIAETVTVFNDMCIMAPASLIDPRIRWTPVDSQSAKATFSHKGISITAQLFFNDKGQLTNFVSEDRYEMTGKTPLRLRFSTPMSNYVKLNGLNVPSYGEAIWHYPEGNFVYGKFNLKNIEYNEY